MRINKVKFFLSAVLVLSLLKLSSARADDYVIALESAGIRATPQFFAAVQTTVPYGTHVKVIGTKGAWAKVGIGATVGWIHKSAFAKAEPILRDLGKGVSNIKDTYKDEVATAGKGFSEASESRHIASDTTLNYETVDQIECRQVQASQMRTFMEEGGLKSKMVGE
jgi:hypothetical protein